MKEHRRGLRSTPTRPWNQVEVTGAMRLRLALTLAAVMALAVSLPGPAAAVVLVGESGASGTAAPTEPTTPDSGGAAQGSWSGRYSMYGSRTHSVQKTDWYCVPTSIQMMFNLIKGDSDRSKANQTRYWEYAKARSTYPVNDNGADAGGWVAAMRNWGAGNYFVGVHSTMQASLRAAAKRMRLTGKPVGLIVWGRNAGGHAWVMTGFESSADPKFTDSYTVTNVQAMGSLWPYGTIGGKPYDPGPKEWVGYEQLRTKFTEFVGRNERDWNGRWVTVLP